MSTLAFWLVAIASAAIAFYMVKVRGTRLVTAMVVAAAAGFLISLVTLWLAPGDEVGHWFDVSLATNGSVGLIFGAFGAAVGYALRNARE